MNSREKLLAAGIGVIATLFVGNSVVSTIRSGFDKKKDLVQSLEKKKSDQELQMTAGRVAGLKLNKVVSKSLPHNEELAIGDYQKWLLELSEEAQLAAPVLQNTGDSIEKDGSYHLYKFKLAGTGTIENATQLLYGFYSKDYLHRIVQFEFRPVPNSAQPDQLMISLGCEVLALGIAKEKQEPPKGNSNRLAKSLDEYKQTILGRNLFAPTNQPPKLERKKTVEAKVGLRLDHTVEAQEVDPNQRVSLELTGEIPKGMFIDRNSGKLNWTPNETGEYKVSVIATDNGIPRKFSEQALTIKVTTPPPAPPPPIQFDITSQAMVTSLNVGLGGPEAWILSKTESKTYKLRKGDQLKIGGIHGTVKALGWNYIELETEGRVWLVGLDETLADAYSRSKTD